MIFFALGAVRVSCICWRTSSFVDVDSLLISPFPLENIMDALARAILHATAYPTNEDQRRERKKECGDLDHLNSTPHPLTMTPTTATTTTPTAQMTALTTSLTRRTLLCRHGSPLSTKSRLCISSTVRPIRDSSCACRAQFRFKHPCSSSFAFAFMFTFFAIAPGQLLRIF
jgi:hypothetical protein